MKNFTIIALWCEERHTHHFRALELANYIRLQSNNISKIIFSGWKTWGRNKSEAETMKNQVLKRLNAVGVCIWDIEIALDEISINTSQNIENSLFFCNPSKEEFIFFSSASHLWRIQRGTQHLMDDWNGIDFVDAESYHHKIERYQNNKQWQYLQFRSQIVEKIILIIEKLWLLWIIKNTFLTRFK
jgi:hypothetical protein